MEVSPPNVVFTATNKGKECVIISGLKYALRNTYKDGRKRYRCCADKFCNSFVILDGKMVSENPTDHNMAHDVTLTKHDVELIQVRTTAKRKAEDDPSSQPRKIVRTSVKENISNSLDTKDIVNIKKAIYKVRRKTEPAVASTTEAAVQQMMVSSLKYFTGTGEKFIHIVGSLIIFTCTSNLRFFAEAPIALGDGTFNYAAMPFQQLYTISAFTAGYYVQVAFCLLEKKTKAAYLEMWRALQKISDDEASITLHLTVLLTDFEEAAYGAAKQAFPGLTVRACRFHLGQSRWRFIQGQPALRKAYEDPKSAIGYWLTTAFGLSALPPSSVALAFQVLENGAPAEAKVFVDYLKRNYIGQYARFPVDIWASAPTEELPTTNNAAESFHSHFNGSFYHGHPPVFRVMQVSLLIQVDSQARMNSVDRRIAQRVRREDFDVIERMKSAYSKLIEAEGASNEEALQKYLFTVGIRYRGNKIK